MSQQVEELIAKIKTDGIQAAEKKAEQIIEDAEKRRSAILQEAHEEAKKIVADAKAETKRLHDATEMALQQCGRDMLLNLRKEIIGILEHLVAAKVGAALTPQQLAAMITRMVEGYAGRGEADGVYVGLNEHDVNALKAGMLKELQGRIKDAIELRPADDIAAGFTISFDQGKSSFDFTQESLVEYLSGFVNDYVAGIIRQAGEDKQ